MDPNEFFYDKLTPKHVDYISKHWEYLDIDPDVVKKYFRHILTMYDISTGIFTKSDPSHPVSWMTYSDIGHLLGLRTLPEYQHKGFGLAVTAHLSAQVQKEGIVVTGEQFAGGVTAYAKKFGQYVADTTWRDSITGEYYL